MRARLFTSARSVRIALIVSLGLLTALIVLATSTATAARSGARVPWKVISSTETAKEKLHSKLETQLESGSQARVAVIVTVSGNPAGAEKLLDGDHVATREGGSASSIVVGTLPAQRLAKLASLRSVVAVAPVEFKQTGVPLGADPGRAKPDLTRLGAALAASRHFEVPYSRARPPKTSDLAKLTSMNVLDAKSHNFYGAWQKGIMGEGSTVSVLDGGTDFGHPDLLGTWRTWDFVTAPSGTVDAGWNGWPKAFDAYGTLIFLVAPDLVDQGLSWYTPTITAAASCDESTLRDVLRGICKQHFSVRTGPARNFAAPDGVADHVFKFNPKWSKSGTVKFASHPDEYLMGIRGERAGVLVADPNAAGVYDTVYVDLDGDYDFTDEKPVTKASPASYRDMNNDGIVDISGGLLYYISDGTTRIPGGVTSFGVDDAPGAGDMLAWTGDFDPGIEGHGTLTASNVVGQGVIRGLAPSFSDLPAHKYPGVLGGAPKAKLAPMGDIYFSIEASTQIAYFLTTLGSRGVDVTSNSYGYSDQDNDGFDAASQEAAITHTYIGTRTLGISSTGNGAPGFGTVTPPSPPMWLSVGASTQFGGTGWDSITSTSQIVDNDIIEWSNRGPGATGANGVDVVADGAYSTGDATLNSILDGDVAWATWGGTSRSTPVAAGAAALVYEAYRKAHPGALPTDFQVLAKSILKSSALDLGYDTFVQGAGSIDAGRAVDLAAAGGNVVPDEWRVGDYRGDEWDVFTHLIQPGGSDTQDFQVSGPGPISVSDRELVKVATETFDWSSERVSKESTYNFNAPDYLIDISKMVKQHAGADLMVVRANYPYASFDGNDDYASDQAWRLLTYSWTDVNHNGRLWRDRDFNGVVQHQDKSKSSNIDGNLDFTSYELDLGEYVRFAYHRPGANTLQSWVRDPFERLQDGIFIGFQHSTRNSAIPKTPFKIEVSFYDNVDWPWVSTQVIGGGVRASIDVPADAPYGMYEGSVVVTRDGRDTIVPVSVAVGATLPQDADGNVTGTLTFGGSDVAEAQKNSLYNNGSVFGATDWTWRAESGDWRLFFFDVGKTPAPGSLLLSDTTWDDAAPHTDLDTLLFGKSVNSYQLELVTPNPFGAPYILDTIGKSPNSNVGAGVWKFNTATGGARDVVAAPLADEGLHALVQHQVGFEGDKFDVPFTTTLGSASVDPTSVEISTAVDSGSFDVTFTSSLPLGGMSADAFGLSQPTTSVETTSQDDPDDPSSASIKKDVTIAHASRATFTVDLNTADVDLFIVYDADNDGQFTTAEIVGSSTGGAGEDELVELVGPPDGNYQVWAQGWQVSGTEDVTVGIDVVQGTDLTLTGVPAGPIGAGVPVTLHVTYSKAMLAGQTYKGEILLGPDVAPTAVSIPITITKTP